jgi:hypothetical protein
MDDQELAERVDVTACESDRAFFRHHPKRNFRVRPAWAAEIEAFARQGAIPKAEPGRCWWIVVCQLVRHQVRVHWPIVLPHDLPPDPPEHIARASGTA